MVQTKCSSDLNFSEGLKCPESRGFKLKKEIKFIILKYWLHLYHTTFSTNHKRNIMIYRFHSNIYIHNILSRIFNLFCFDQFLLQLEPKSDTFHYFICFNEHEKKIFPQCLKRRQCLALHGVLPLRFSVHFIWCVKGSEPQMFHYY